LTEVPLSPPLLQAARRLGFTTQTPIWPVVVPFTLLGRGAVAPPETGRGKPPSFFSPILPPRGA